MKTEYYVITTDEPGHLKIHAFERKGELDKWLTENCALPISSTGVEGKLKDDRPCIVMRGYPMPLSIKVSV